jgi:UDP-galactose transporter
MQVTISRQTREALYPRSCQQSWCGLRGATHTDNDTDSSYSFQYTWQTQLFIFAAKDLDAATFQVTGQLKILTTAFFSVLFLGRELSRAQWASVVLLALGACLINVHPGLVSNNEYLANLSPGLAAALVAVCLSGYCSVYVEALLKNELNKVTACFRTAAPSAHAPSLLCLNLQMSAYSALVALLQVLIFDSQKNLFHGFNKFTWLLVLLSAGGGLLVAAALKFTDSLIKVRLHFCVTLCAHSHHQPFVALFGDRTLPLLSLLSLPVASMLFFCTWYRTVTSAPAFSRSSLRYGCIRDSYPIFILYAA